jgi:hypothetical protein
MDGRVKELKAKGSFIHVMAQQPNNAQGICDDLLVEWILNGGGQLQLVMEYTKTVLICHHGGC